MSNDRKIKTEDERKLALEEALKRVRPKVINKTSNDSVTARLEKLANRTTDDGLVADKKKEKNKSLSLKDLAKKRNNLDEKAKANGLTSPYVSKDKDDKSKEKDKDKEKEKNKENTPEKQAAKMKEMFSKVKLPSGMEIHQEGPQWVLVSKDGKQRTDVTDVMNTIDKFNRNIDAANEQNRMENAAQSSVDKAVDAKPKDNGLTVNETSGKIQMVGEALPKVKDVDGQPVFKPEDMKKVAETAIDFSNEKALLEKLKDPKALEEMQKREKNNERQAEEARRQKQFTELKERSSGR